MTRSSLDDLLARLDKGALSGQIEQPIQFLDKRDHILANEAKKHLQTLVGVCPFDERKRCIIQMMPLSQRVCIKSESGEVQNVQSQRLEHRNQISLKFVVFPGIQFLIDDFDQGHDSSVDEGAHLPDLSCAEEGRHDGSNRLPSLIVNTDQDAIGGGWRRHDSQLSIGEVVKIFDEDLFEDLRV